MQRVESAENRAARSEERATRSEDRLTRVEGLYQRLHQQLMNSSNRPNFSIDASGSSSCFINTGGGENRNHSTFHDGEYNLEPERNESYGSQNEKKRKYITKSVS
jgi:hypothetical protein